MLKNNSEKTEVLILSDISMDKLMISYTSEQSNLWDIKKCLHARAGRKKSLFSRKQIKFLKLPNGNIYIEGVGLWSIFLEWNFMLCSKHNHSRDLNFKFQLNWSNHSDVRSNFVCRSYLNTLLCSSLIMVPVTIVGHVFNNIFQTEYISAVKFLTGYKKTVDFIFIWKSQKRLKKIFKNGPTFL